MAWGAAEEGGKVTSNKHRTSAELAKRHHIIFTFFSFSAPERKEEKRRDLLGFVLLYFPAASSSFSRLAAKGEKGKEKEARRKEL